MAPNHPDVSERDRGAALFTDMLELACQLRAPGITTLPGIDWPHESHEESLERAAVELGRRAEQARERGVRFSIEPHAGSVCQAPVDAARLCELAPGLELTVDYTHHVATGSTEAQTHPLLRHARHFHARGGDAAQLQTSLKHNTIDYEAVVDEMDAAGYDGFLSVEYLSIDEDGFAPVDVASETVLMRDRLAAKLAGRPWTYPEHA
jgi:sugar phosphate isomerase/epimerase